MHVQMDSGRLVALSGEHKHVDHGYAVTSHSSQGATADRVLIHAESNQSAALVNQRFAYVAGSRMRNDVRVYTDNAERLSASLNRSFDKAVALPERAASQHGRFSEQGLAERATGEFG